MGRNTVRESDCDCLSYLSWYELFHGGESTRSQDNALASSAIFMLRAEMVAMDVIEPRPIPALTNRTASATTTPDVLSTYESATASHSHVPAPAWFPTARLFILYTASSSYRLINIMHDAPCRLHCLPDQHHSSTWRR